MDEVQKILNKYPEYISYYWNYQYRLGKEYILPFFKKNGTDLKDKKVLEIGAGEGGVLMALAENKVSESIGFDLREGVVQSANEISADLKNASKFYVHNMYNENIPTDWKNAFDIILMRDVIEHLDNTRKNLETLLKFAHKGSMIFITFPPYYSPYGAHQHTLKNFAGKLPYIQLFPDFLFNSLISSGRPADVIEVKRLREIKLTLGKFRKEVKSLGLNLAVEKLYILRPVFKIKFGIPSLTIKLLSSIPILRELLTTEAAYLLKID